MLVTGVRNASGDIFKKEIVEELLEEELELMDEDDEDSDYNCGGYALGTKTWFLPIITLKIIDELLEEDKVQMSEVQTIEDELISDIMFYMEDGDDSGAIFEDIYEESNFANPVAMKIAKSRMLNAIPTLRAINSLDEVEEGEYGVAYACSSSDFHFIKIEDNYISQKCGTWSVEDVTCSVAEAFKLGKYTSDIMYFANKY